MTIDYIVCDVHCDTVLDIFRKNRRIGQLSPEGHLDIPRLKIGKVNVQVFAIYIEKDFKPNHSLQRALQLIDSLFVELSENKDTIELAISYEDIIKIVAGNKIAAIMSIEGGEALEGKLSNLRIFYYLGVRMMTLTWNQRNDIADGSDEVHSKRGLTPFGKRVVEEMNRLRMVIDVSHISESGFWDVLKNSQFPVIASHSNCAHLCPHQRNLKDSQIRAIAEKKGLICITYVPEFLVPLASNKRKATIYDVIEHIKYVVQLVGVDFVGLGSDFDGCSELPIGLEGANKVYKIKEILLKEGYSSGDIKKIMGGNFLKVFQRITRGNHSIFYDRRLT